MERGPTSPVAGLSKGSFVEHPVQDGMTPKELDALHWICHQTRYIGHFVELGALHGGSTRILAKAAREINAEATEHDPSGGVTIFSVDTFAPVFPTDPLDNLPIWRERLRADGFTTCGPDVPSDHPMDCIALRGLTSYWGEQWLQPEWQKPISLLLIDADHSEEGCRADFDIWSNCVYKDGIVVFHDYDKASPGVMKVVDSVDKSEWRIVKRVQRLIALMRI